MHTIDTGSAPNATPSDISHGSWWQTLGTVTTSLNNLERQRGISKEEDRKLIATGCTLELNEERSSTLISSSSAIP